METKCGRAAALLSGKRLTYRLYACTLTPASAYFHGCRVTPAVSYRRKVIAWSSSSLRRSVSAARAFENGASSR